MHIHCVPLGRDHVVRIRLIAAGSEIINTRLHDWPTTTAVKNFVLSALPTGPHAPVVPASKRVTAVPPTLTALGEVLDFGMVGPKTPTALEYRVAWPVSKIASDHRMLAKTRKWMLRQWLADAISEILVDRASGDDFEVDAPPLKPAPLTQAQVNALAPDARQAYQDGVDYWSSSLQVTFDDCFISQPDATGDFYALLGKFRNPKGTVTADTVQYFRGIVVPFSTIEALSTGRRNGYVADLSSFNPLITPAQRATIRVLSPADYTRPQSGQFYFQPSGHVTNFLASAVHAQTAASPFCVTYAVSKTVLLSADNPLNPPWSESTQVINFIEQHRLDAHGNIQITPYDTSPFEGSSGGSNVSPGGINFTVTDSPAHCKIAFYTGEELEAIGAFDFTGCSNTVVSGVGTTVDGLETWSSAIPGVSLPLAIDEYIDEYGLALSVGHVITNFGDRSNVITVFRPGGAATGTFYFPGPLNEILTSVNTGARIDAASGTGYGLVNGFLSSTFVGPLTPLKSGLPLLTLGNLTNRIGGVNWYRDGPTGIFRFVGSADTSRNSDCMKYQKVFNGVFGFRAAVLNPDGSVKTPADDGWEDLDVILSRIVANTTVLVNNFASPALYPWLLTGMKGVIL